ncbi:hypothetical protein HELRODRAFT_170574 [Helobdella robusta]|uniref:Uncharacterized protein n=1 Tax=Helobdella robusta TaxID=6412 RepID=T1F371_HELRO|nr:hypothetical protein HELRODRAFT_170574 [Helobdella robusta]ESO07249.1 hypothetical protein HELRODRAFT_170574 [Helobdella robusta]
MEEYFNSQQRSQDYFPQQQHHQQHVQPNVSYSPPPYYDQLPSPLPRLNPPQQQYSQPPEYNHQRHQQQQDLDSQFSTYERAFQEPKLHFQRMRQQQLQEQQQQQQQQQVLQQQNTYLQHFSQHEFRPNQPQQQSQYDQQEIQSRPQLPQQPQQFMTAFNDLDSVQWGRISNNDDDDSRAYIGPLVFSILVTILCGVLFGLIALVTAGKIFSEFFYEFDLRLFCHNLLNNFVSVSSKKKYDAGNVERAKFLRRASYALSIIGLVVGAVILAVVIAFVVIVLKK